MAYILQALRRALHAAGEAHHGLHQYTHQALISVVNEPEQIDNTFKDEKNNLQVNETFPFLFNFSTQLLRYI